MSTKLTPEEIKREILKEEARKLNIQKQQSINNPNKVIKK